MSYNDMQFATEISKAILRGDDKMLLADGSVLDLPGGQKCGTETQKQTYANMKAIEIVDEMKKQKRS